MSRLGRLEAGEQERAAEAYAGAADAERERAVRRVASASLGLALTSADWSTRAAADVHASRQLADMWAANAAEWNGDTANWAATMAIGPASGPACGQTARRIRENRPSWPRRRPQRRGRPRAGCGMRPRPLPPRRRSAGGAARTCRRPWRRQAGRRRTARPTKRNRGWHVAALRLASPAQCCANGRPAASAVNAPGGRRQSAVHYCGRAAPAARSASPRSNSAVSCSTRAALARAVSTLSAAAAAAAESAHARPRPRTPGPRPPAL